MRGQLTVNLIVSRNITSCQLQAFNSKLAVPEPISGQWVNQKLAVLIVIQWFSLSSGWHSGSTNSHYVTHQILLYLTDESVTGYQNIFKDTELLKKRGLSSNARSKAIVKSQELGQSLLFYCPLLKKRANLMTKSELEEHETYILTGLCLLIANLG